MVAARGVFWTLIAITALSIAASEQDEEEINVESKSAAFQSSYTEAVTALKQRQFEMQLLTPQLGSLPRNEFDALVRSINEKRPIAEAKAGRTTVTYDVILQPGHYGRSTGATGTAGKLVSERELVAFITARVANALRSEHLKVLVVPADNYIEKASLEKIATQPTDIKLHSRIFLAIHADGRDAPCKGKASLGYDSNTSPLAMHTIGYALSRALGYKYSEFERDNFSVNEARYYMFRSVNAPMLKGVLEIGELTCQDTERLLIGSSEKIAANVSKALRLIYELKD